ncbi:MAG: spore coat protein CotJB [Lachnospiraceae bacterium]|jgi:spore coat protein JB|nr:spore coat protein CotJB [Lachnospiraceae bacterium]
MAILSEKEKLMLQIQNCSFAMKEAELFLDTHPTCREAIEYYQKHKAMNAKYKKEYSEKFGLITMEQQESEKKWSWVQTPFPWERSVD